MSIPTVFPELGEPIAIIGEIRLNKERIYIQETASRDLDFLVTSQGTVELLVDKWDILT